MEKCPNCTETWINTFSDGYMEKLFYFCLRKTGNSTDAEDLTQDIALNILTALRRGTVPANLSAWVWKIARNRYAAWVDAKHRRNELLTGDDIGDCVPEDSDGDMADRLIHAEQLSLLRRELAFIGREYRSIIVAHYLEPKSVREIAAALSLSPASVKQRLYRARNMLKEGMQMAREFGKRSYSPEQVSFVQNGRDGKKGQPWSILTHLLYKNIFLEAYENPCTAEELSLALGMALPYMEDELEFLVREQLMRRTGDKYQTDFPIVSREEQLAVHETNLQVAEPLTRALCTLIDTYMAEDGAKVNVHYVGYETAKWTLLVRTFDALKYMAGKSDSHEYRGNYPNRPDEGCWTVTGYEHIDWKKPAFVGQHGYISYDRHEVKRDIDFGQFKFFWQNIQSKTPEHLTWQEAYTLWLVCTEQANPCEKSDLEKLGKYGYLRWDDGDLRPNVVIFNRDAKSTNSERLTALQDEIFSLFAQAPGIERGYAVEQALAAGWLKYDETTPATVGAYIYL